MKKEFTLLEILSGISGYLLINRFDRLHELIEWVMGGAVFTHQIPGIADIFKKRLILQFPQFSNLQQMNYDLADTLKNGDMVKAELIKNQLVTKYGNSFEVTKGQK